MGGIPQSGSAGIAHCRKVEKGLASGSNAFSRVGGSKSLG
jgi:hypothetical protein